MDAPSVTPAPAAVITKFNAENFGHFHTNGGGALVDTIGTRLMGRGLRIGFGGGFGSGANSFGSGAGALGSLPSSSDSTRGGSSGFVPGSVISSG
jgi:hypothetical protein